MTLPAGLRPIDGELGLYDLVGYDSEVSGFQLGVVVSLSGDFACVFWPTWDIGFNRPGFAFERRIPYHRSAGFFRLAVYDD